MSSEVEPRDHTEVAAAAAQRPHELWVCGIRHFDDIAGGCHELRAHELIGRQPPCAHHPADAAAEGQPADSDRGRVARADAQVVAAQDLGDVTPRRPAADAHEGPFDLHVAQSGEVEGEPAGDAAPRAVPAAAHHDRHMLIGRPAHGRYDVGDRADANDRIGLARARMEVPRRLPSVVARHQNALRER